MLVTWFTFLVCCFSSTLGPIEYDVVRISRMEEYKLKLKKYFQDPYSLSTDSNISHAKSNFPIYGIHEEMKHLGVAFNVYSSKQKKKK